MSNPPRDHTTGNHESHLARFQAYDTARERASKQMVRGFGLVVIAALIIGVGYRVDSGGGGIYSILLWGAMAWGALQMAVGIYRLITSRRG